MTATPKGKPADEDLRLLISSWSLRVRRAQLGQARAASVLQRNRTVLGMLAAALATIVGSAVFATIGQAPGTPWRIGAGVVNLAAAVCAALQTFLHQAEDIIAHETSSREFGAIRRELGEMGALRALDPDALYKQIGDIRLRYDQTSRNSPNVPLRIWKWVEKREAAYWPREFSAWPENPALDEPSASAAR